jgi:[acyl-carrier-protein] S-malonyltransferase
MGRELALAFPEARATFEEADEALGFPLSTLCWEGPEEELTRTLNAQPAILVHTVAVWRTLEARAPVEVAMAAGHSLGEFSAHVAAGTLAFADAVRTVRLRGELMFAAGNERPGGMAAILGLDDAAAESVCEAASSPDASVVPANYNSPGQIVVSGDTAALERLEPLAREAGAKRVIPLNVSGAFHSPLMEPAVSGLREALDALPLQDPSFPVVSNVTAESARTGTEARDLLVRQLTAPVRWTQSVQAMRGGGIERFLEIGPNSVLTGLLRRIDRSATGRAVGTADELTTFLAENG